MIFNRTDLRKGVSGAKFDAEPDFEVHLAIAPPKSMENDEKLSSKAENSSNLFFRFFKLFGTAKGRKAEIFTARSSRRPRASCASEKFAK